MKGRRRRHGVQEWEAWREGMEQVLEVLRARRGYGGRFLLLLLVCLSLCLCSLLRLDERATDRERERERERERV